MTTTDAPTTEQRRPRRRRGLGQRRNVIIGIALVAGFALGVGLVLIPDDDTPPQTVESDGGSNGGAGSASLPAPKPLEIDDTSMASIAELTDMEFPASAEQFQTAATEDLTQLDVSFTIPTSDEAAFLTGSGLSEPVEDERTILHSSPLWKLNADGTSTIRGVADATDSVNRAVELVPEGEGRTRVRIVITPA